MKTLYYPAACRHVLFIQLAYMCVALMMYSKLTKRFTTARARSNNVLHSSSHRSFYTASNITILHDGQCP